MRPSCCADSSLCSLRPGGPKGPWMSVLAIQLFDLVGTWPMFVWLNYSKNVQWQSKTTKHKYVILTHKICILRTSENHCNIKQPQISKEKDAFSSTTQSITALPGIQQNCMGSPGSSKASSATSQQEMNISSLMPHSQWDINGSMDPQILLVLHCFCIKSLDAGVEWFWTTIFFQA